MRSIDQIANNPARQTGAALLLFTALLVVISASVLLDRLSNRAQLNTDRELETTAALAEARAALIGWAVSHSQEPGRLPWPDRNGDANYDGSGDCFAGGVSNALLLGRFPFSGDATPCSNEAMGVYPLDGAGEPLFYAVSQNLIQHRGKPDPADPPINPGLLDGGASYPWLKVVDQNGTTISDRVAAVIIAPGAALEGQDRSAAAPDPDQFLDSVAGVESNSDNDLVFIQYPDSRFTAVETDSFNDRLVYITIDELMRKVEKRVLGDAAVALRTYRTTNGRFPWLSLYRDPPSATGAQTVTGRLEDVSPNGKKITDDDADFSCDVGVKVKEGDLIVNVTRRTFTIVKKCRSATELDIDANIDFVVGHAYNVLPAFNGIWGQREGHIPFIDSTAGERHALATGFTLTWSNGTVATVPPCEKVTVGGGSVEPTTPTGCDQLRNSYQSGTYTVAQPTVPTPLSDNGECIWTDIGTADCMPDTETRTAAYTVEIRLTGFGCGNKQGNVPVQREYKYTLNYSGTGTTTSTNNVKTRRVANIAPATIEMTDTLQVPATLCPGVPDIPLWSDTVTMNNPGDYVLNGIYFDIEDGVEFPGYFFTNRWHQYIYAKIAADHVAINELTGNPSTDSCTSGTDCVTLQIGATTRPDVQAVLIGAGGQLTGQTRSDGNLSDYFENDNAITAPPMTPSSADRAVLAATFNDQVRVVAPDPP